MARFEAAGYHVTHDSDDPQGEIVVVNTCGFIADAKEESINTILEFAQAKTEGRIERLYVMGCLSERYLADLEAEIPEVDGWYGKFNYTRLLDDLEAHPSSKVGGEDAATRQLRHLTTPSHYAYVKISEGCDRHCAYCAIPLITGKHRSRSMDDILDEVRWLVGKGVKEIQLIAQELTKREIGFEYLHGGVPSETRGKLITNFADNPNSRVFLSTDAGSTGLNLQSAATIINLDLPWNPAILEQRIARIYRLGQQRNVQVINLVSSETR